ncbi:hypothetical protein QYF61_011341 [Mycteria americana]|uniref:Uncharacterized protein n=1 Tax=Mycteria americana TaxID=33587 RepID=A0AAN7ND95_MYCAM|nr:hypothetical protein QYF61_011341 [Mycteria americana]
MLKPNAYPVPRDIPSLWVSPQEPGVQHSEEQVTAGLRTPIQISYNIKGYPASSMMKKKNWSQLRFVNISYQIMMKQIRFSRMASRIAKIITATTYKGRGNTSSSSLRMTPKQGQSWAAIQRHLGRLEEWADGNYKEGLDKIEQVQQIATNMTRGLEHMTYELRG